MPTRDDVFINVPYDRRYESLYLALIAGLSGFGLTARATVEIPGSTRRLERIFTLLSGCRYSFHDLSRVGVDRTPPPAPRFNMPFELGLAVAIEITRTQRHDWFVLEARRHRLNKSLSDLAGTDAYVHDATADGVLVALTNALVRRRQGPTVAELRMIYQDLRMAAVSVRSQLAARSLYEAGPFGELVVAARRSAAARVVSRSKRARPRPAGARRPAQSSSMR